MIERELRELYWKSREYVEGECEYHISCGSCPVHDTWCELRSLTITARNILYKMHEATIEKERAEYSNKFAEISSKIEQLKTKMGI